MNTQVARKLHERRYRSSPVMTTGELLNLIGSDGIQEALLNRWIVPDPDTGFLTLNTGGGKLLELENACRCSKCSNMACDCVVEQETPVGQTMIMRESFKGFGLTSPSTQSPTSPPVMPRPQTPTAPTSHVDTAKAAPQMLSQDRPPRIGDNVTVAEDNVAYVGTVGTVGTDGRYRINFGTEKPKMNRDYGPNEIQVINKEAL